MKKPFLKMDKKEKKEKDISFLSPANAWMREIKPRERFVFHSDYYEVDGQAGKIMDYFHTPGAGQEYCVFWGMGKIPPTTRAISRTSTVNIEQIERMSDSWIREHQSKAEQFADKNAAEQDLGGSLTNKGRAARTRQDLRDIAMELMNGASYLNVKSRLIVKAPDLETLDEACEEIDRRYTDTLVTLHAAPYYGQQRKELSTIFKKNEAKNGDGLYFTSTEYAGSYMLVTHGLEDPGGEYVGMLHGDINSSAVLFDINRYAKSVVVATGQVMERKDGTRDRVSDVWGSKISQAAMQENGRVVHMILNDADLDRLGPRFDTITHRIDMGRGELNMFEMFGPRKKQNTIYAAQLDKLVLMTEQVAVVADADRAVFQGSLREILNEFYIDAGMWQENARDNAEDIRVVGIPHRDVPRLKRFVPYLDTMKKRLMTEGKDVEKLHAVNVLLAVYQDMLTTNGDLFNSVTTDAIDGALGGRRTIYDFSGLSIRGQGIAMAQFVNVLGFAVQDLGPGDTLVIHGAQNMTEGVKPYVKTQIRRLQAAGARAALLYDSVDDMLDDSRFNAFADADYTILGDMRENTVKRYEKELGTIIAPDLKKLVQQRDPNISYVRRGFDNVVFVRDLQLRLPEKKKRRKRRRIARKGAT